MSEASAIAAALPAFLQPPLPSVFSFEITARCQHACRGCGNVFPHAGKAAAGAPEMDVAQWAYIGERLRPYLRAVRLTGGEPTLHPQFERLVADIDGWGVPFVVFTNGLWSEPRAVLAALSRCVNLEGVLVSLHGIDAESHRRYTGSDAFVAVVDNIRAAVAAGLNVATNTLLVRSTYRRIAEIAEQVLSWGVTTAGFGRHYGPPLAELSLTADELRESLARLADLRRAEPRVMVSNCVPLCFLPELEGNERGCTSGFTHATIGPAGEIRPCTHSPIKLGYIQHESLEQLWQSSLLQNWRAAIPAACLRCAVLSRCRGGCRATAWAVGMVGDPLMRAPLTTTGPKPKVELALTDRPRLIATIEAQPYGLALSGVGRFVTLSVLSRPIVEALDGRMTIGQLQARFGAGAVQLVGALAHEQLVELEEAAD